MSLKWIIIAILAFPVAELGVYLAVASEIGFFRAFLLQLVCSAAGFFVLRRAGRVRLARWRAGIRAGGVSGLDASAGGAEVLGGILLLVPGFITDMVGAILLVPPLRQAFGAGIRHLLTRYSQTPGPGPDPVIDLKPGEWHEVKTRKRIRKPASRRRP
jgi:UPF0716 protein FxsA